MDTKIENSERLMKVSEVSEVLRVSPVQVYRLLSQDLPAVRFAGSVRVRPEDLQKYIADHLEKHDQE
jgi:excisionase family DNA binding protein